MTTGGQNPILTIDLTGNSFTEDSRTNIIIEIDNEDSFQKSEQTSRKKKSSKNTSKPHNAQERRKGRNDATSNSKKHEKQYCRTFGECPICWEELGHNQLASTKCGHVFCYECLEQSLRCQSHCPTCRRPLKGSSAFHRLYLDIGNLNDQGS